MAKKATGKSAIPNWKKKKWYELLAPSIYSDKSLGESLAESPEHVLGKVVEANMMNLTGNPRKQNFTVKLRVVKVQGNKGLTKPTKLTMLNSTVRRLIRSGKERVDVSFVTTTKDGVKLRIKPLLITKNLAARSKLSSLQEKAKEFLNDYAKKNGYEAIFDAATRNTLQKEMKEALDKVFPLKMVEIRALEVELEKGVRKLPESQDSSSAKVEEKATKAPKETKKASKKEDVAEDAADSKEESEEKEE